MAGNQLGKCISGHSLVETTLGPVRADKLTGNECVYSWDGARKVPANILAPFQKSGLHDCALIIFSDGRWIECADHHRILTLSGWRLLSELLPKSFFSRRPSIAERGLSVLLSNVLNCKRTLASFLGRCLNDFYPCGELLHASSVSAPESVRLQADARPYIGHKLYLGGAGHKRSGSPLSKLPRQSNLDALRLTVVRSFAYLSASACKLAESNLLKRLAAKPLCVAVGFVLRLMGAVSIPVLRASLLKISPCDFPNVDGNHIIAVVPIGRHKVYDFTVPGYHNYCAGGLVHHNTMSAAAETAIHATGRYPDWWQGKVFQKPINAWVSGVTGESARDNPQRWLYGPTGAPGTGMVPKDAIRDKAPRRGLADALDTLQVRFGGGGDVQAGTSYIGFKSYDQGREKWQGPTKDLIWFDEEPPLDIYTEGLTRTNVGLAPVMMTFTPLLGMSDVVKRFLIDKVPGTHVTQMTIDEAAHYSPDERAKIIASYPAHERDARSKGIPTMGSGRVFPIDEDDITVAAFEIPPIWPQICGLDFGWDHPSAGVRMAWDRDNDVLYVTACYRARENTPLMFAGAVKPWGAWLPWSWPHDGLQHDKGSGVQLANQYRGHGLKMLGDHAKFEDGTWGVEAGIAEMLDRMQTGRLRVFSHLNDWFEEFRMYHRKNGLIVKENDDLMSATRYAMMMRRSGTVRLKKAEPVANEPLGWMA